MEVFSKSDIGLVRNQNQDDCRFGVISPSCVWVYLCDGRLRGVEHPKKKKKKHIQIIHSSAEDALIQSMQQNLPGEKDEINRRICKTLEAYLCNK